MVTMEPELETSAAEACPDLGQTTHDRGYREIVHRDVPHEEPEVEEARIPPDAPLAASV